jgi:hypothetical protein
VQAIIGATQKRQGLKSLTVAMAAVCLFDIRERDYRAIHCGLNR